MLDYDPDLGGSLRPDRRAEARDGARATMIEVRPGTWRLADAAARHGPTYGFLLLDGLATRTVVLHDVAAAQLLGRGDLVSPADEPDDALLPTTVRWTVFEPLSVALLDERFLLTIRRWPELAAALFERLATQSDRRSAHLALCQLPRVEDRLHAMLWLLAERWGHVTSDGVILPMRLTHELLGELVGAKRPTVSLALKELEARDAARRRADGAWLLDPSAAGPPRPSAHVAA